MELRASKGKNRVYAGVSDALRMLATETVWSRKKLSMEGKGGESRWSNPKAK